MNYSRQLITASLITLAAAALASAGHALNSSPATETYVAADDTITVNADDDDAVVIDLTDDDEETPADDETYEAGDDEFGGFTPEGEDEFGELPADDAPSTSSTTQFTPTTARTAAAPADSLILTEGMRPGFEERLNSWEARQYLNVDSSKVTGKEVSVDDNEYARRLQRIPAVVELPYNDVVRKYIEQYVNRMRRSVSYFVGAMNFYVPIFEEALEAEGCPLELKYLPIIESALDPTATSPKGAAGLWQFMISAAKTYKLEVNSLVDERRDPVLASRAAARMLSDNYQRFGDWTLAIAAYNCGPSNVEKAIQRAGGERDFWQIYPYLPGETRNYVPAFIAATYAMTYYCEHDIVPMDCRIPIETDTLVISRDLHLQQVSELCDISLEGLKTLNPQYRQNILPGLWKPCTLRLPADAVSTFLAQGDSIYTYRASTLLPRRSTVSINTTAVPEERTATASKSTSKPGKSSYSKSKSSSKSKSKSKKPAAKPKSVTIKNGDTLSTIARRNGTTVEKLKKLNGIKGSNIRAGKTLRVK